MVDLKKFLDKQLEEINKDKWIEGEKLGKDPGREFVSQWIKVNALKFRKKYALGDLKEAIHNLKEVKNVMRAYLDRIRSLNCIIDACEEKILEGVELLESEVEDDIKKKST